MTRAGRSVSSCLLMACVAFVPAGCGSGSVVVHGQLLMKGQPYRLAPNEQVFVVFISVVDGDPAARRTYPGVVTADGSYRVPATGTKGIPAGKYRIAVTSMSKGGRGTDLKDKFNNVFGTTNSPIMREVSSGETTIDLDLGNPDGAP